MISVVMATYNGEKYLIEQLESIRKQTITPDEVIICDDKSSDSTQKLVQKYISDNELNNWHFFVNEINLGYGNNFNQAVNRARGELIFFSDQDDIWELNKIEKMKEIMDEKCDCMLLCTDYYPYASEEGAPVPPREIIERMPNDGSIEKIELSKKSVYIGALGCCMAVKKDFVEKIKNYWFDSWAQDDRMWRLAQCVDGCYVYHNMLVKHRLHSNNTATYGKYHSIAKRTKLFNAMLLANEQMSSLLMEQLNDIEEDGQKAIIMSKIKMMQKHIEMMRLRIDLIENKKVINCIRLAPYLNYYEKAKSYVLELYIALKGK